MEIYKELNGITHMNLSFSPILTITFNYERQWWSVQLKLPKPIIQWIIWFNLIPLRFSPNYLHKFHYFCSLLICSGMRSIHVSPFIFSLYNILTFMCNLFYIPGSHFKTGCRLVSHSHIFSIWYNGSADQPVPIVDPSFYSWSVKLLIFNSFTFYVET